MEDRISAHVCSHINHTIQCNQAMWVLMCDRRQGEISYQMICECYDRVIKYWHPASRGFFCKVINIRGKKIES